MIHYSLNWMGPINTKWIEENGDGWATGRIDVSGDGVPEYTEIGLPTMKGDDWDRFEAWLDDFETETVWTLDQLVEEYEKTNSKITWWKK